MVLAARPYPRGRSCPRPPGLNPGSSPDGSRDTCRVLYDPHLLQVVIADGDALEGRPAAMVLLHHHPLRTRVMRGPKDGVPVENAFADLCEVLLVTRLHVL